MPLASSKLKWCVLCRVSVSQNFVFHHYPVCLAALIFDWSYFILSTCWKLFHNFLCQFSTFFIVIFKPYTIISIYRQDVKRIRCFSHPAPISRIATCWVHEWNGTGLTIVFKSWRNQNSWGSNISQLQLQLIVILSMWWVRFVYEYETKFLF